MPKYFWDRAIAFLLLFFANKWIDYCLQIVNYTNDSFWEKIEIKQVKIDQVLTLQQLKRRLAVTKAIYDQEFKVSLCCYFDENHERLTSKTVNVIKLHHKYSKR